MENPNPLGARLVTYCSGPEQGICCSSRFQDNLGVDNPLCDVLGSSPTGGFPQCVCQPHFGGAGCADPIHIEHTETIAVPIDECPCDDFDGVRASLAAALGVEVEAIVGLQLDCEGLPTCTARRDLAQQTAFFSDGEIRIMTNKQLDHRTRRELLGNMVITFAVKPTSSLGGTTVEGILEGWTNNTEILGYSITTERPTQAPTTAAPTQSPTTSDPTTSPSQAPTHSPIRAPTISPTSSPSNAPLNPTAIPSESPSLSPSLSPTSIPSQSPSISPSQVPTTSPTSAPTKDPSTTLRLTFSIPFPQSLCIPLPNPL